jgi:hypothetical protein
MRHALTRICICTAWLLSAFLSDPILAQHRDAQPEPSQGAAIAQAGPANAVVEFENESIVVVRVRMAPHEKTPMHDIAQRAIGGVVDRRILAGHSRGRTQR